MRRAGKFGLRIGAASIAAFLFVIPAGSSSYAEGVDKAVESGGADTAAIMSCSINVMLDRHDSRAEVGGGAWSICDGPFQGAFSLTLKRDGHTVASNVCDFNITTSCDTSAAVRDRSGSDTYRACATVQGTIEHGPNVKKTTCATRTY